MRPEGRQRGFGLVAAMFVIVIIAALIAVMARLALTQNATNSLAIQQARAYQAARAGLEYGIARSLAGAGCSNFSLNGFAIGMTCTATPAQQIAEENRAVQFYTVTAIAEYGTAGTPDYAYRRLTAVVEK